MAVSAFKSTSRRGNLASSTTNTSSSSSSSSSHIHPPRRSRSVSAVSRDQLDATEFLNKRDNPLFWTTTNTLPPENPVQSQNATDSESKFERKASKFSAPNSEVLDATRGRSVSRTSSAGNQIAGGGKGIGRSRSVSRRPVPRGNHWNSESEVEQECSLSVNSRNRRNLNLAPNNGKKANLIRTSSEFSDQINNTQTLSSQHRPSELSDRSASGLQIPNSEDEFSVGSFSEAEEKTIKAVCEQIKSFQRNDLEVDNTASGIYETVRSEVRRAISEIQNDLESAIRRNNAAGIATTNVTDIPPDLVNPGAVELVLDIREEYAKKLEQSQERARILRADLAVEEHRGQELSRILKEILPEPKITPAPKSRMGRKVCFIEIPSPSFVPLNAKKLVPGAWINLPVLQCVWTHATLITYSCLENHISKRTVQHKFHLCFDSPLSLIGCLFPTEMSILLWFIKQVESPFDTGF
ncbi:hypothetical protein PVL29_017228 [Vitis rotundifolia]|uniref:Uncharacterized protein n=1 Tax=Vitis rotundifolia TaxID=103349 RepID=A0AA38ZA89_VITRO|nr:hypothetical protein PVL29_017228 [Vitis rotundifolia]